MKAPNRSLTKQDTRSFVDLRHDLNNNIFAILCLCGIEWEKVLVKEETNDNLRDIYVCAAEANAALHIMFSGLVGTEPHIQPYSPEADRLPSKHRKLAN